MAPCANCSKEFPSQYINCPYCGFQRGDPSPARPVAPELVPDAVDSLTMAYRDMKGNVRRLMYGLPCLAIAPLLFWVPAYGEVLAVSLGTAGSMQVLMGWRGLGGSGLRRGARYRQTFWGLFLTAGVALAILALSFANLGNRLDALIAVKEVSPVPAMVGAVQGFLGAFAVALVIVCAGQALMAFSLRELGEDLAQKKLRTAGILLLAALPVEFVTLALVLANVSAAGPVAVAQFAASFQRSSVSASIFFAGNYAVLSYFTLVLGVGLYFVASLLSCFGARGFFARSDGAKNP